MKLLRVWAFLAVVLFSLAPLSLPQSAPSPAAARKSTTKSTAASRTTAAKSTAPAALTNRDVIRMTQAKVSDDIILSKIKLSKTSFDTSVDGLINLRHAGVSNRLITVMMNPAGNSPGPAPTPSQPESTSVAATSVAATSVTAPAVVAPAVAAPPETAPVELRPGSPSSNAGRDVAPAVSQVTKTPAPAKLVDPAQAPQNYGVYIEENGELKLLGRMQTKVQLSKLRTSARNWVPFTREKIDINIPGAHSTSRHEILRPNFYAYFPPSRDVSKFKLLQAKITGQKLDQRTVANASILFSTEQNQDEVLCDIGPTSVKDLYRISPREDLPSGEFGFVEGNTASRSTSDIEIIDVWDFAIDKKEDKLPLPDFLSTLSGPGFPDSAFLEWTKADCQKIIDDREGKLAITGSMTGWFKRQYETLDVYWADRQFAQAFARLEMLDKQLSPDQARKLAGLLIPANEGQFYVVVSIGAKIGSGKLIGANEGERIMRPFDATLTSDKGKDGVAASRLEFIGGYAGLWKSTFDQKSIRGQILTQDTVELDFEARLNQNLDFKAKFPLTWVGTER